MVLLDSAGTQRDRTLSSDCRSFVFVLPAPGRYRVRAERIGYAGVGSPLLEVGEGETRDYRLQVRSAPIALEGIRATGTRRCTSNPYTTRTAATNFTRIANECRHGGELHVMDDAVCLDVIRDERLASPVSEARW